MFFIRELQSRLNLISSYIPPPPTRDVDRYPRRILLVHAHPVAESFSNSIADTVENAALACGHDVRRINLCPDPDATLCYRPNMSRRERLCYFQDDVISKADSTIENHISLLKWCDTLIFVYPTWWMNTPASLKGFFDRTLLPGACWDFPRQDADSSTAGLVPLLTNIDSIVGISTYGASRSLVTLAGDNGRRMISNAIRPIMNPKCAVRWMGLYDMDFTTLDGRTSFLSSVEELVGEL